MKRTAEELDKDQDVSNDTADDKEKDEPAKVAKPDDFWRCQIEAVYARRNPHKLSNVQALLEKYSGREAILYAKVCKTYDLDPSKFYTDPQAWEQYETDVKPDEPGDSEAASHDVATGSGVSVPSLFGISSFDQPAKKSQTCSESDSDHGDSSQQPQEAPKAADVTLFYLYGVVPISYQGKSYNIPVTIYFDAPYPKQPPRCFVTPTNGMALKPNHLNVDAGGMIYLPYLSSWSENASTLPQLLTAVTECFSQSPPVYSTSTAQRPTQEQQAAQPAQSGPVAGVLNFLGLGGQQSTPAQPAQPAQPAAAPAATPVVAAVPVAKAVAQPVRPVATVIATTVPSRNEKEALTKAVTASMKERWPGIVEPLTKDLKEQMDRKEELQTAQAKVEQEEKRLQDAVAEVEQQTRDLQKVESELDTFIQAESGRENFDPDAFLETMEPDRRQVLDLLSEELSYEELLTALDELLASRKIGVEDFMREVRDVSRQQFMCKMKRKKAEKAVNAAVEAPAVAAVATAVAAPVAPPPPPVPRTAVAA